MPDLVKNCLNFFVGIKLVFDFARKSVGCSNDPNYVRTIHRNCPLITFFVVVIVVGIVVVVAVVTVAGANFQYSGLKRFQ